MKKIGIHMCKVGDDEEICTILNQFSVKLATKTDDIKLNWCATEMER